MIRLDKNKEENEELRSREQDFRQPVQSRENRVRTGVGVSGVKAFLIIGSILCVIAIVIVFYFTYRAMGNSFADEYLNTVGQKSEEAYNYFYDNAYKLAEKRNHVKNEVILDVSGIRNDPILEVFTVSASDIKMYKIEGQETVFNITLKNGGVVVLEGSCTGIFTVDLNMAEAVVDNENKYVLVRVPAPSLTDFTTAEFDVKYFDRETKILNGSTKQGVDAAIEDTKDMTEILHKKIMSNVEARNMATESAKMLIENTVKRLNPGVDGLTVEVEFFS